MARRQKHWLWEAYLALAAEGGRTEPQGREFLKQTFPSLAHLVDPVIQVLGKVEDLDTKLLNEWNTTAAAEEAAMSGESVNRSIREYMRNTDGRFAAKGDSESSTNDGDGEPQTINDRIRGRARGLNGSDDVNAALRDQTKGIDPGGDVNAQIRAAAGR